MIPIKAEKNQETRPTIDGVLDIAVRFMLKRDHDAAYYILKEYTQDEVLEAYTITMQNLLYNNRYKQVKETLIESRKMFNYMRQDR